MVTLNDLEVWNFFAIEHERVVFEDCGFVVVVGPNGAGKTALTIEGPLYALYGTSFEYGPKPGSEVCSHWAKTWKVALNFHDQNQPYRIERGSDGLKFFRGTTNISRGKAVDTQELIEQVIGRSEALFRRSVIFSVNMKRFPELPEADKKELFDELMGIGVLNNALKTTNAAIAVLEREVETLETLAQQTHMQLEREIKLDQTEQQERPVMPVVCETELLENRRLVAGIIREAKDKAEQEEQKLLKRLRKIRTIKDELSGEVAELTSDIRVLESEVKTLDEREKEQKYLILSGKCPSCKQTTNQLEPLDFTAEREKKQKRITKRGEVLEELREELTCGRNQEQAAERQIQDIRQKLRDTLIKYERELQDTQEKLAQLKASQSVVKSRQATIDRLQKELKECDDALETKRKALDDEKVLQVVFGPKGCRVAIFNGMLPLVNEELMTVSEAANSPILLQLTIREQGESFAGNFGIQVTNPEGSNQYKGSSAGEKRQLDLLLVFALMQLADKRARTPFNHAFFDETLENLDDTRASAILSVLKTISAQKSSVILTAHRAEKLTADQLWTVQKGKITVMK